MLTINRVRRCLVHRHGRVGPDDVDERRTLTVRWLTQRLAARAESGLLTPIDGPTTLAEASTLVVSFDVRERTFPHGSLVKFEDADVFDTVCTLVRLSFQLMQPLEALRRAKFEAT